MKNRVHQFRISKLANDRIYGCEAENVEFVREYCAQLWKQEADKLPPLITG